MYDWFRRTSISKDRKVSTNRLLLRKHGLMNYVSGTERLSDCTWYRQHFLQVSKKFPELEEQRFTSKRMVQEGILDGTC